MTRNHFGVYGIVYADEKILLVHKARGPYTGTLDLVGGRREHGETYEEALTREVREESGIKVIQATYLTEHVYTCTYEEQGKQINFIHTARIYRIDGYDATTFDAAICMEDVKGAGWFEIKHLRMEQVSPIAAYAISLIKN